MKSEQYQFTLFIHDLFIFQVKNKTSQKLALDVDEEKLTQDSSLYLGV